LKILYITFKNIASLNAGDKIVSYSFLKQISENYQVTLVNILDEGSYSEQEIIRLKNLGITYYFYDEIETHSVGTVIDSMVSGDPVVFTRKRFRKTLSKMISSICDTLNPGLVIWDHFRSLAYFPQSLLKFRNLLVEHNDEGKVMLQRSRKSHFPVNLISYWQSKLIYSKTNYYHKVFSGIIFISSYDITSVNKPSEKYCLITKLNLYFHHANYKIRNDEKLRLIFVGSLDWFPNTEGITWFVKEVLPFVKSKIELHVVGRRPIKEVNNLSSENIFIYSNVLSIEEHILASDIFLAPLFSGSGINIKILEALSYGIPIVGSTHAFRGYDGLISDGFKSFDKPAEFAKQIDLLCSSYNSRCNLSEYELSYYAKYKEMSKMELVQAIQFFAGS